MDAPLVARLEAARLDAGRRPSGSSDRPHTRHLNPDGSPRYTNRLALESSPYLQQHAHNPVNWYPWGDEAFATARQLGRPVLLSVGYSTCHWCHVMEEESFEDEEIARVLNENYVAIKVDREERPDIDGIYMRAVQALTGSGGWPMNVWLTPDREPFFGGSYFPARDGDRGVHAGFLTLLRQIAAAYRSDPGRIAQSAAQLTEAIRRGGAGAAVSEDLPDASVVRAAVDSARRGFDSTWGGEASTPKFPSSLPIRLLLRDHRRTGDPQALAMATLTLEKMAAGGMHDQVGGGFHRYSTDRRWLVPHFEKMLYDNALLAIAYLEAYQATGREDFATVARRVLRYVERDMTSPEGAFYSATDADSPAPDGRREEGRFFTWTPAEIDAVLGPQRGRAVAAYYGVTAAGNFDGRSILSTARPLVDVAAELGVSPDELRATVDAAREDLYAARAQRPPPPRDEKIIAAWNGLMISALSRASLVLGDPAYAERAARAADFVLTRMRRDGRLRRSARDGRASGEGYLDDYAFMIAGLLDLDEATGDPRWLREAMSLDRVLEEHYEDRTEGGFFLTGDGQESLLDREKPSYDGAEPSGNSVELLNLLRLSELTGDDRYRQRAERTLAWFAARLRRSPEALGDMLLATDFWLDAPKEIVIITPGSRADAAPFLDRLRTAFVPNRTLTIASQGAQLDERARLVPLVEGKLAQGGKATAYVCERGVCALPTTSPETFARQIATVRPLPPADPAPAAGAAPPAAPTPRPR